MNTLSAYAESMIGRNPILALSLTLLSITASAWDGTDSETGSDVEIERGTLVRSGRSIEYFDYGAGEYKSATVESIRRYGSTVEVEVTDDDTGEVRTLDMDAE